VRITLFAKKPPPSKNSVGQVWGKQKEKTAAELLLLRFLVTPTAAPPGEG